jgi:hypothetical protein
MAFVRFVVSEIDEDSGQRQGLFQALSRLQEEGRLLPHEMQQWEEVYDWFRKNLDAPARFTRSSRPHARAVAISWFKDTAAEHIRRIRALVSILRDHGVSCEVIQTRRPGYVVFEDEYQVVAEPFRETQT